MKTTTLLIFALFSFIYCFSQEVSGNQSSKTDEKYYNIFSCKGCNNKYFISTNSGLTKTPVGIRIGMLCKTGFYLGARFGQGKIYHSDSDFKTVSTTLFSVTGGIIIPAYIKNDFSIHLFAGGGIGEWWDYRWERWTKSGFEFETGLMISYKKFMLTGSFNMLTGYMVYETYDGTIGFGYRF